MLREVRFIWIAILFCAAVNATGVAQERAEPARQARAYSAAPLVAGTNSMDVLENKRSLSIGDRVSYRVVQERSNPIALVVTDSGEMEVPLIGRIRAAGKTCRELAYELKSLLEKDYFNRATVIIGLDSVTTQSRGIIYLMGEVKAQGPMQLPVNETLTVSKAILRAGGFADYANERKVKVVRKIGLNETKTMTIDVSAVLKGRIGEDIELQAEDLIIVPEKLVNF